MRLVVLPLKMKRNNWIFLFFSVLLFVSSALLVAVLSFLGVYFHHSLDYFFHEGYLGTFYPVALLAISSLSCFLFHLKLTPSITYIFENPLSQKILGFGVDSHSHIFPLTTCLKYMKK